MAGKCYLTITLRTSKDLNIDHGHGPVDHFQDYIDEVDPNRVKVE